MPAGGIAVDAETTEAQWLLTAKEAAPKLRLGRSQLYRLVAEGETFGDSVVRLGPRCLRFSAKRLKAYCDREADSVESFSKEHGGLRVLSSRPR
jgi:predicted DNA-binding transcriptional regulator AlpA